MAKLKVTYAKSAIGFSKDQKATIWSLGLRKLNSVTVLPDTSTVRGMIFKVKHLVRVEEVSDNEPTTAEVRRQIQQNSGRTATVTNGTATRVLPPVAPAAPASAATSAVAPAAPIAASVSADDDDDLTLIEGIGPKIAGILAGEGVTTFRQLAGMSAGQINALLADKVRIANAETWAEQAQLAADGKMSELKALQDTLNAGRRD